MGGSWTRRARQAHWLLAALSGLLLIGVAAPVGLAASTPRTPYPGGTWAPEAPQYGVLATENVLVPMRDGVNLTVDVYYPSDPATGLRAAGPFPALLTQTPYTLSIGAAGAASGAGPGDYYVSRGYVYVSADVRGTGRSMGSGEFFGPVDARDGVDLVKWVSTLDGVNGDVGLHGCSYLGHTQLYTAAELGTELGSASPVKAMIPGCVSSDPYRDTYMENGVPAPAWEGAGLAAGSLLGPTIEAYMVPKYLESQTGGDTSIDGTFWNDRDHLIRAEDIVATKIPALLWNGWNDSGFGGLELYSALQNAAMGRPARAPLAPGDRVTGSYQLILGDWGHGGGLDDGIQLQWYDTWLKHRATGLDTRTRTPLHVENRTTHEWTNLSSYPVTDSYTPYYLAPGGQLSATTPAVATDQLGWGPVEQAGNSVTYTSAPLGEARTLAGPSAVRVSASSTNADLQLRGDLYDVDETGAATPITHGGILGRLSAPDPVRTWTTARGLPVRPFLKLTQERPVVPGATVTYDIPLQPTLWTLPAGHRLRLRIASQADQSVCVQKQTAITIDAVGCRPRAAVVAGLAGGQYVLGLGGVRPSLLSIPLVRPGALHTTRSGLTPTGSAALPLDW